MRLVHHHKKKSGVTYVYEILEEYWDKDKKQMRNKQRCIGKLDPKTGDFIPSARLGPHAGPAIDPAITATTTMAGASLVLQKVDKDLGLSKALKAIYPDNWAEILSLAWYVLGTGNALSYADTWCADHEVPYKGSLSSQHITDTLNSISDVQRIKFVSLWESEVTDKGHLCCFIATSSRSATNDCFCLDNNCSSIPILNLAVVFGQDSSLPLNYCLLPPSIMHKEPLYKLYDIFDELKKYQNLHLIMNRCFYSQDNVEYLLKNQHDFTIAIPTHLEWIREQIDTHFQTTNSHLTFNKVGENQIHTNTVPLFLGEDKKLAYLHLYFDDQCMSSNQQAVQYCMELNNENNNHEYNKTYLHFFSNKQLYERGQQIDYRPYAIDIARKNYAGFSALLTTKWKDAFQALDVYQKKDWVEKAFDNMTKDVDISKCEEQSLQQIKARHFIQFIALILFSRVQKTLQEKLPNAGWSVQRALMELDSLTTIHYSGQYKSRRSDPTIRQLEVLKAFNIQI